jgi:hypothetical protein
MTSMATMAVFVTGGVDTHGHTHHAAVLDCLGRQLGDREHATRRSHPRIRRETNPQRASQARNHPLSHWGSIRGAAETDIGRGFSVVSGDGLVAEPLDGQF